MIGNVPETYNQETLENDLYYDIDFVNIIANKMKSNNLIAVLCLSFIALGLTQLSVDEVRVSNSEFS